MSTIQCYKQPCGSIACFTKSNGHSIGMQLDISDPSQAVEGETNQIFVDFRKLDLMK